MYQRILVVSSLVLVVLFTCASDSFAQTFPTPREAAINSPRIGVQSHFAFPSGRHVFERRWSLLESPNQATSLRDDEWIRHELSPFGSPYAARASKSPGMVYAAGVLVGAVAGWGIAKRRDNNPLIGMTIGLGAGGFLIGPMFVILTL